MRWFLLPLVLVLGCVKSQAKMCGEFTCGSGQTCSLDGTRCVSELAQNACSGLDDGAACSSLDVPTGVCTGGLCVFAGCGNNILEPKSGEVCDDGNRISGDGCSALCDSKEVCGDAIVDALVNEQCDCGSDAAHLPPGCASINSDAPNATCRMDCTPARCSDGVVDAPGEVCDDRNTQPGDGCRADCGGRWTMLPSGTLFALEAVSAVSATDAWTVGGTRLLHWDGATWSPVTSPAGSLESYIEVCARSAQEVYAITTDNTSNTIVYRHDGPSTAGTWSVVSTNGRRWRALYCNATGMWAAGSYPASPDINTGRIGVWNGTTFDEFPASSAWATDVLDVFVSAEGDIYGTNDTATFKRNAGVSGGWELVGGVFQGGQRISGSTNADITVVNPASRPGSTAHYNGSTWLPLLHSEELQAVGVDTSGATTVLVGNSGAVMICSQTACAVSTTGAVNRLDAAEVLGPNQIFAVGEGGTILY